MSPWHCCKACVTVICIAPISIPTCSIPIVSFRDSQQKNNVLASQVATSELVAALTAADDRRLLIRDIAGMYHFNGSFRNAGDVASVLDDLAREPAYAELARPNAPSCSIYLKPHLTIAFTGRSGTFFAFEGLGSIYWHMVSKLLLAAQECYQQAVDAGMETAISDALAAAYYDIRAGIGFNKTPDVYGAFPTDPYSHTPMGGGASQPGMTGQVKEEIFTRWGELGVMLRHGMLCFSPTLLRTDEFLLVESEFNYVSTSGDALTLFTIARFFGIYCLPDACHLSTWRRCTD